MPMTLASAPPEGPLVHYTVRSNAQGKLKNLIGCIAALMPTKPFQILPVGN